MQMVRDLSSSGSSNGGGSRSLDRHIAGSGGGSSSSSGGSPGGSSGSISGSTISLQSRFTSALSPAVHAPHLLGAGEVELVEVSRDPAVGDMQTSGSP